MFWHIVHRVRQTLVIIALLLACAVSCDRSSKEPLVPVKHTRQVQLEPIAQLSPNCITHVVADRQKNLYWSQEAGSTTHPTQDVMFVKGATDLPRATDLTSRRILALLDSASDARASNSKSGGNIQSLALGSDGGIYFYFSGSNGRSARAAFGWFDPVNSQIRIVADTQALMTATQMGDAIALARGELIVTGGLVRLLIRHTDKWVLLDYDPRKLLLADQVAPEDRPPLLVRTITRITVRGSTNQPREIDLTNEGIDLFAGPDADSEADSAEKSGEKSSEKSGEKSGDKSGDKLTDKFVATFVLMDQKIGGMYAVDDTGAAKLLASLVSLPKMLSSPLIESTNEKDKHIVFAAADSDRIDPINGDRPDAAPVQTAYPALLSVNANDGKYQAIGREYFHAPGEFAIYAVQLQQLVNLANDTCVGYDRSSGQILQVRLRD